MKIICYVYRVCVNYKDVKCNRYCFLYPKVGSRKLPRGSHYLEVLLTVLSPQNKVPKNSLHGSHLFE